MKRLAVVPLLAGLFAGAFWLMLGSAALPRSREVNLSLDKASAPFIFHGRITLAGQYASTVGITYVYKGVAMRTPSCSGILVGPDVVLSAGHCICDAEENGYKRNAVVFGDDPGKVNASSQVSYFPIKNSVPRYSCGHPESQSGADLSLFELDRSVIGVSPTKLASGQAISQARNGVIVGYGAINAAGNQNDYHKREAVVPIISTSCLEPDIRQSYSCVVGKELVAGQSGQSDTCYGDSGGPLLINEQGGTNTLDGNDLVLVAITSRAAPGHSQACGVGGIYELLDSAAQDWIMKTEQSFN